MKVGTSALLGLSSPLPALQPWLTRLARSMSARLSGMLEQAVTVSVEAVREEAPLALLARLEEASYVRRLRVEGSNESGLLQVDNDLAAALVDRLLGGPGGVVKACRELTDVEVGVLAPFAADLIGVLNDEIAPLVPTTFVPDETETVTSLARRLCSTGGLVVTELNVALSPDAQGSIRLGIPGKRAHAVDRLLARPVETGTATTPLLGISSLQQLPLTLHVETAPLRARAGVVAQLGKGTRLRLGEDPTRGLRLVMGRHLVAQGRPGVVGLRKALTVTAPAGAER